jgi:hypothetical protein
MLMGRPTNVEAAAAALAAAAETLGSEISNEKLNAVGGSVAPARTPELFDSHNETSGASIPRLGSRSEVLVVSGRIG